MNIVDISRRIEIKFWAALIMLMQDRKALRSTLILFFVGSLTIIVGLSAISTRYINLVSQSDVPVDSQEVMSTRSNEQMNILVVLVDQLTKETTRLEGVWLVVYQPLMTNATLLPIYPSPKENDVITEEIFAQRFGLNPDGSPSKDFFKLIDSKNIEWHNFLVLDNLLLAEFVQELGYVNLGRGNIDGSQVIKEVPSVLKDPEGALSGQARLANGICNRLAEPLKKNASAGIISLLTNRAPSNLIEKDLLAEWEQLIEFSTGLSCEFPSVPQLLSTPTTQ